MIDVFVASRIITMNESWPLGTAVAVRDGIILEVGTMETLDPWLQSDDYQVHEFTHKTILPGLIDPHLHPMMAAVLLPMHFVTALPWDLPWQQVAACPNTQSYRERLKTLIEDWSEDRPFFTWGYHASWHGQMNRELLDAMSGDKPVVVWHRSFHELYMNSSMMTLLEITEAAVGGKQQIDLDTGRFYEVGLGYAIQKLNRYIMSDEWIHLGLERLKQIVHLGGHTTVGDMAVGLFDYERERQLARDVIDQNEVPFRVLNVPHAAMASHLKGGHQNVIEHIDSLIGSDTRRLRHTRHIKMFTDGAFFSQLAMLQAPGYVDGHQGEWLMAPEQFRSVAAEYWQAGYAIHVHCTGDLGLELAIDTLEHLQHERPRFRHGFTIEHFGFSTPEQVYRIGQLGAMVSANVYYLHELSERYAEAGVGFERAYTMSRLQSCVTNGIPTAIHSDFPMAPATPLKNAWVASTRENAAGKIAGENEALSIYDALKAVTIDAARMLGLEDEIGSIRAGKKADFTIIDRDPLVDGSWALKQAKIVATVFEGEIFPLLDSQD